LCRYQRVYGVAEPSKGLMRARFVLAHEAAESDHIGMQDRGEFPLPGGSALRRLRRDINLGCQADVFDLAPADWDDIRSRGG
jgi:hypothetical protein